MSKYDLLNPEQKEAVFHYEGPLLILAGAGSGKTRVLTHRVAWLIEEKQVNPWNIMAITFTNKAAGEMRDRVETMLGGALGGVWVATFHSTCVRILRRYIDRIGFGTNFTIYDGDDQKTIIKEICKRFQIDTKLYRERFFMAAISAAKDELLSPDDYAKQVHGDTRKQKVAEVYREYQKQLRASNALDFDDLIFRTVELFQKDAEVLEQYQDRFRFIMVDEYQDTNTAQFKLVSLLAAKYRNLCVVGDDDQSIYRFRGANIHNILNFEKIFPATKVIRLEQNYRSTKNILAAASGVIKHNSMRKEKTLWTTAEAGAPISYGRYDNEYEEAQGIAADIHRQVKDGMSYSDFAILYRTNAQSRVFEEKLIYEGIPYRIIGAVNFYARKEIKDILCYLKTINNSADDIAIKRIINIPRRGIGQTTIGRISDYAFSQEMPFYEALRRVDEIPGCTRASAKIHSFVSLIEHFRMKLRGEMYSLEDMTQELLDVTGYVRELEAEDTDEANGRIENIESLMNKIVQYEEDNNGGTLNDLLEDIALVADIDTVSDDAEQVLLMTLHSAKGLEFPNVYICGMEETIFPGASAVFGDDPSELEEERRLCYVGITRAMKKLTLTSANQRMRNGEMNFNRPSRFINEIPRHLVKQTYGAVLKPETESKPTEFSRTKASLYTKDRKNPFANNPYIQKGMGSASPAGAPDYQVGDRVSHTKFGQGIVRSLTKLTNDYEVVIEFDGFGQRKLRSSFAKLTKL